MALAVVGVGVGRTGTNSLQEALQRLLGGRCYHMSEVLGHLDDHVPAWRRAVAGQTVDWSSVFDGYRACVDWPAAACWRQLADANPDAVVLLSERDFPEQWWASFEKTILEVMRRGSIDPAMDDWFAMGVEMLDADLGPGWDQRDSAIAGYLRRYAAVRAEVPAHRLVEWKPSDGWGPLCDALGVPVPDEPFPVTNSTSEFRAVAGLDGAG